MNAVASAAEELSASVEEIGRQVRQSAGVVEQAGLRTEKSVAEIESLAAATQRIDGVLNLIQTIAEQTNLLALNATIEAARAGEAGRGFAVVAHEVKALAEQTAKATSEIGQNVGLIQSSTRNAVDAVREIGDAVRDINDVTSNIAGAVGQQDAATREISSNAQSAAQGNETLVANIGSLSEAIGETNKAATSVLTASSDLTATAETLSREVDKFFRNLRADALDGAGDTAGPARPTEIDITGHGGASQKLPLYLAHAYRTVRTMTRFRHSPEPQFFLSRHRFRYLRMRAGPLRQNEQTSDDKGGNDRGCNRPA